MNKHVAALFIHGIGQQHADFAADASKWLSSALAARGDTFSARSVHWAPVLDGPEAKALRTLKRSGSSGRLLQRVTIGTLTDALAYPHYRMAIQQLIDYEVRALRCDEFVVFAHSLGCLIAMDYLRARPMVHVGHMVTMGCNLQLFYLGSEDSFDCPVRLRAPGMWTNLYDDDDAIGFPLRAWLPQVRDVEVASGGWLTRWNGASHVGYFGSKKLWRETIPGLIIGA